MIQAAATSRVDGPGAAVSLNQERQLLQADVARSHGRRVLPFNLVEGLRLRGPLERQGLERALEALIERHVGLRTVIRRRASLTRDGFASALTAFARTGVVGDPVFEQQAVLPGAARPLRVHDIARASAPRQTAWIGDVMAEEASTPFELDDVPKCRVRLIRCGDDDHAVVLTMPHLIADVAAVRVCWRDLFASYAADGAAAGDSRPPLCGLQFAARQWRRVEGDDFDGGLEYWRSQWEAHGSAQIPPEALGCGRPLALRSELGAGESGSCLPTDASAAVRRAARLFRTTPCAVFLAAFAYLAGRRSGVRKVAVWMPFANRAEPRHDNVVGWLTNSHLLGLNVSPTLLPRERIAQSRAALLDALAYQDVPLQAVWRRVGNREHPEKVIFDWRVGVPVAPTASWQITRLETGHSAHGGLHAGFAMRVFDTGTVFRISALYSTGAQQRLLVDRFVAEYAATVHALAAAALAPSPGTGEGRVQ